MKTTNATALLFRRAPSFAALAIACYALTCPMGAQGNDSVPPPRLDEPAHWDVINPGSGKDTGFDLTAVELTPGMFAVQTSGTLPNGTTVVEYSTFYDEGYGVYSYENHTQEMFGWYIWDGDKYVRVSDSSSHPRALVESW